MNPQLLADPTAAPESEQPSETSATSANGSGPEGAPAPSADTPALMSPRTCANCGAELADGQDWCLQCGTGAPGSLDMGGPGWRSATAVLGVTAVLVLGAAAAAYAALTQPSPPKPAPRVITVAQVTPTPVPTPTTPGTTSTPVTPTTPGALGTPTTIKPLPSTTPPKIPLAAPTPTSSTTTPTTGTSLKEAGTGSGTPKSSTKPSGGTGTEQPTPILLDTNAASTYNPYGYPASGFGDPSLAIDGETSTGWTALLNPAVAPKMAEGLAIDLKTAQRVRALTLISSTPGMTVQVYGANGSTLPASITDPAWTALSPAQDAKKRTTHITLRHSSQAFRFIALWISRAPASSVGTATAPGHVSVNELELFA